MSRAHGAVVAALCVITPSVFALRNYVNRDKCIAANGAGIVRETTDLHPDLKTVLYNPPAGVKIYVKFPPDTNGAGLSDNKIAQICAG